MAGLAVQNFASAGVGIAVLIAVVRGFARRDGSAIGNFWYDLTRTILYVLLPVCIIGSLFLVSQGVVQSFSGPDTFKTVAGGTQTLFLGPVASQEIIKELGTNGGGFYNVNASMPFENSTTFTNFVLMLSILAIPAGLTATFGRMVGSRRQGWAIYVAMTVLFVAGVAVIYAAESHSTAAMHAAGLVGGNMEGKEQRFGIGSSSLFAAVTTVASCGAVNAAMESLTALGGAIPLANISLGEVVFGGVGSGLYGMLLFVLLAVFLAGLMVGRTPEYLGKKIEAREIKLVVLGTIGVPLLVLVVTAVAVATSYGKASIFNAGPQGFTESLYAYTSQANNNGSAFAGYTGFLQPNGNNAGSLRRHVLPAAGRRVDAPRALPPDARRAGRRRRTGRQARDAGRPRDDADRHTGVRRPARRDHPPRRPPDVRPRAAARADRAVDDEPALLGDDHHAQGHQERGRRDRRHDDRPRPPRPARHRGDRAGRLPERGRRLAREGRRQGRGLQAHRPGLLDRPEREALLPEPPVGDRVRAERDVLQQPRAQPGHAGGAAATLRARLPAARATLRP